MAHERYTVAQMVKALRDSKGTVYVAAKSLGCVPQTVYTYAARHPSVQETIDSERGLLIDTAEIALARAVLNGEAWAVSLTLKTIGKKRGYVERQEVTGADGGPIHNVVQSDIDREIGALMAEMAHREKAGVERPASGTEIRLDAPSEAEAVTT